MSKKIFPGFAPIYFYLVWLYGFVKSNINNIYFYIIHDSILCTEGDKELVKEKLIARIKELFSDIISKDENLDKLFKINRVSIKDEDLEDNKNPRLLKEYLQSIGEWEDDWDNELNLPL